MSIRSKIELLKALYKPQKTIKFCRSMSEITGDPEDPNVIYVVLDLDRKISVASDTRSTSQ